MFFKCVEIESKMNRAGAERVPFLFGLDFEMNEGFFIENPMLQNEILFEVNGISNFSNQTVPIKSEDSYSNNLDFKASDFNKYNNKALSKQIDKVFYEESVVNKQNNEINKHNGHIRYTETKVNKHNSQAFYKQSELINHDNNYQFEIFPEEYSQYKKRFEIVMEGLRRGDSYLTNLTVKTPINTSLSLKDIFIYSSSPYKLYIPNKFVCFSPECFVKINNGKIMTYPMKGTIEADIKDAEHIIMNDDKEKAEHNTIVDLLRNDLSSVSENVIVKRFRYLDKILNNRGNLLQVSSEIEGTLNNSCLDEIGTIIFKLMPAGSVSGASKKATMDIIRNAEQQVRGYYTGVAGYFDGKSFNSFILIRFIEQENSKLYFRSGGGITAMSDAEKEYREVLQKVYMPF